MEKAKRVLSSIAFLLSTRLFFASGVGDVHTKVWLYGDRLMLASMNKKGDGALVKLEMGLNLDCAKMPRGFGIFQ